MKLTPIYSDEVERFSEHWTFNRDFLNNLNNSKENQTLILMFYAK